MKTKFHASSLAKTALGAVLICVTAWITVPSPVPFTLQTMGVFLVLLLLGGARGTASVLVYIAIGALGLPVFSGFRGGAGILLGATGGYIAGFLVAALLYWLITSVGRESPISRIIGMAAGMIICYALGTLWYAFGYASSGIAVGLGAALVQCVLPFLIPDAIKLVCAYTLASMIKRRVGFKL